MGDYLRHGFNLGKKAEQSKLPRFFDVNWFRRTADGKWLWPGFGENSRVLQWVFERCAGTIDVEKTAIGYMSKVDDIDLNGLKEEEIARA